jgi:TonB family protein
MNNALMYFLKVNIAIALFYIFYRLVFYRDTFWATRRFYLVFSILLSVVYPFISLSGWLEKQVPMQVIMANYVQLKEITITNAPVSYLTIENVLLAIYGLVSFILLIRMVVQLSSILRWRMKGKKQLLHGIEIVSIDNMITPFSFFSTIFMNPALHNEQETDQILTHENTHARQLHSIDVLLSELMTIIFWINPASWLLKYEIRHNLEFLADNSVIQSGYDSKNYQYHLLQLSYQIPDLKIINKFNVSPLKKRITMMNQQKSKKAGILKYSLIVPLALALVLSGNAETLLNKTKNVISQKEIGSNELAGSAKTDISSTVNDSKPTESTIIQTTADSLPQNSKQGFEKSDKDQIYTVVEKMPQYPGGENELLSYIGHNIKYPVEAQQKGIQGTSIIRFVVNKFGKVENAVVARGIDHDCDNEALRIVNSLPDWIPGEQNGKKVSVYYVMPITFRLKDDSKAEVKGLDPKNPPLYIVDGIEVNKSEINTLKPENIKEISVLKDASATAIYGDKGKNGVVLITMKKWNQINTVAK